VADAGFTIVEVLIVLAISGMLFVSAAILINGRQNKTMFMSAVNDFRQQLQQIINQTQSGYYGGTSIPCTGNVSGTPPNVTVPSSNGSCIFLGSAVQFTDGSSQITVTPVVGNRVYGSQDVDSLAHAQPTQVSTAAQTDTLEYGLKVVGSKTSPTRLAIISSLASYSNCGLTSCINTGGQSFGLYNASNIALHTLAVLGSSPVVCVNSGTTTQSAQFTVGGEGVTTQVFGGPGCVN